MVADEGRMPELSGAISWLNTPPLTREALRGKVVLVSFWTYTCINSLRPLPYVKAWADKYKGAGLVVIGVHTPEFSVEKDQVNVERAVRDLKVTFPVALDSDYRIWKAFHNHYWPALYFIDAKGRIRQHFFGEGEYDEAERVLQALLRESGAAGLQDGSTVRVAGEGVEAPPSDDVRSPETYVGYGRGERFASPGRLARDAPGAYRLPDRLSRNDWGLAGSWTSARRAPCSRKRAVGSPSDSTAATCTSCWLRKDGRPVRFKVRLDGAAPSDAHGSDVAPDGSGEVREPRLYQLIRQGRGWRTARSRSSSRVPASARSCSRSVSPGLA